MVLLILLWKTFIGNDGSISHDMDRSKLEIQVSGSGNQLKRQRVWARISIQSCRSCRTIHMRPQDDKHHRNACMIALPRLCLGPSVPASFAWHAEKWQQMAATTVCSTQWTGPKCLPVHYKFLSHFTWGQTWPSHDASHDVAWSLPNLSILQSAKVKP
jgi:hypothetical protein